MQNQASNKVPYRTVRYGTVRYLPHGNGMEPYGTCIPYGTGTGTQTYLTISNKKNVKNRYAACSSYVLTLISVGFLFLNLHIILSLISMENAILGMGNPLLDISSLVDQALLDKYEVSAFCNLDLRGVDCAI